MKIGFIGAGKVGFTLGKYLTLRGIEVVGYYSRQIDDAKDAAMFTDTQYFSELPALLLNCDTIFVTVPDAAITDVWKEIKQYPVNNKNICHCSGGLASDIFTDIQRHGGYGYSVHPIYAIHDKYNSFKSFSEVYFTVEGHGPEINPLITLIESIGNPVRVISAQDKALYHAASAMMSNLVVALAAVGSDLFSKCGFDRGFSQKAWNALFIGNAENICASGVTNALTGPLERGDAETIRKHINALSGTERQIYMMLSQVLLNVAKQKHPDRDYSFIEAELTS